MSHTRKKGLSRWTVFAISFLLASLTAEVCAASVRPFEWTWIPLIVGVVFGLFCFGLVICVERLVR
jgi:hypothetical protein